MAEPKLLAEIARFERNSSQVVIVSLNEFAGRRYLDVRLWYRPSIVSDELRPGKGITVPLGLVDRFAEAIQKAAAAARELQKGGGD